MSSLRNWYAGVRCRRQCGELKSYGAEGRDIVRDVVAPLYISMKALGWSTGYNGISEADDLVRFVHDAPTVLSAAELREALKIVKTLYEHRVEARYLLWAFSSGSFLKVREELSAEQFALALSFADDVAQRGISPADVLPVVQVLATRPDFERQLDSLEGIIFQSVGTMKLDALVGILKGAIAVADVLHPPLLEALEAHVADPTPHFDEFFVAALKVAPNPDEVGPVLAVGRDICAQLTSFPKVHWEIIDEEALLRDAMDFERRHEEFRVDLVPEEGHLAKSNSVFISYDGGRTYSGQDVYVRVREQAVKIVRKEAS